MDNEDLIIARLINKITIAFPVFGGGQKPSGFNPLEVCMKDDPPQFALGVSVEEVVRFVIAEIEHG